MALPALSALTVIVGLGVLLYASDIAVNRARKVAFKLGVSELLIGLTVISIGTSLPEIFLNLTAGFVRLQGLESSGIAIGNVIGSCLSQITIILGLVGLVTTLSVSKRSLKRDGIMLLAAIMLMYVSALDGEISRLDGAILVFIYALYLFGLSHEEKLNGDTRAKEGESHIPDVIVLTAALLAVVLSSTVVVREGLNLAAMIGVSPFIIGLLAGVGTSLPELSISLGAVSKGAKSLSFGNLIGSNITDPLLSIGLGAGVAGFLVDIDSIGFDFGFWVFSTLLALLFLWSGRRLDKMEGSFLIILFLGYVYLKIYSL